MRSFFKKPAWADTADEPSAPEFYRRSHQTYNDILKANKQQRSKDAAESPPSTVEESTKDSTATRSPKRRRVSDQTDELDESKAPQENIVEAEDVSDVHDSPHHTDHDDESNECEISEQQGSPSGVEEEITGDGAVEQEHEALNKSKSTSPEIQIVEVNQVPQKPESKVQNEEDSLSSRLTTTPLTNGEAARESTAEKEDETTVEILVTSELENTRPLVVRRHLTQRFRDVRLAWCVRQGFDQRMRDSVYLTWNKRRLFDVTTCRSLNINGLDPSQSSSFSDDLDDDGPSAVLRIHVEAVTDDLLKARAAAAAEAEHSHNTDMTMKSQGLRDGIDDEKQKSFHIMLKSRGYDELRLKVLPQTPISQILASFRSRRSISPDTKISLSFDGEVLDANMKLQDYEVTDMDLLDVNLR